AASFVLRKDDRPVHDGGAVGMRSVHAGAAAQLRSRPTIRSGTAALPCPGMLPWPTKSAVIRKIIWLLPPMARAVVPSQPSTRGWRATPGLSSSAVLNLPPSRSTTLRQRIADAKHQEK